MSLLLFVACTTTEESPSSVPNGGNESVTPSITLEQNFLNFDEHADVQTISFSSTMDWTAELINDRADGWCSISATSGTAGSKDIDVTVTENTSTDDRTASVIIKSGAISKTVRISQKQRDALTVTSSTFEIEGTSGKIYIEVKANVDFEYTINGSAAEWITPVETRAMKTSTLAFNIAENKTMVRREGTITVFSGDLSETITVYQKDHGDAILLSQNEYVVSDTGEDIAVEVTSNVDVEIEMPGVDWITRNVSRAVSTNTYYFTIAENTSYDQREAYITFKNTEKKITERVKVSQVQRDAIVLAAEQYNVTSEGEQITIELGHNVDFDFEIVGDWITHVETRALQTNYLVFEVASNASYDSREGSVIFTANNGSLTQVAKIFQAQKDAIIISDNDIVVSDASQQISFDVETNIDFSVIDPDVDWLHPVVTRGLTTHTLTYTVDENTTYDSREAQIVVKNNATNITQTVTVTQAQKDAIVLAKSEYEIELEGGALDFDIQTNVEVSVSISEDAQSWITQVVTRGLETRTLYFDIAPYDGDATREGTITISGGNAMQTINVCQFSWQNLEDNKIYYTSSDGKVVTPNENSNWGGARIISNTYENGQGVITFSRNLTEIGSEAFCDQQTLTSITIPDKVKSIGYETFKSCKALTEVTLGSGLETISESAFLYCGKLESITIPDSVTSIGQSAFQDCLSLNSVTFGKGLETIGESAFAVCNSLTSITIPDNVKSLGNNAFNSCKKLVEVNIGNGVKTIGSEAFRNCEKLAEIYLGSGLETIEWGAFANNPSLTRITIPNNVKKIGSDAFYYCDALTSITIPNSVKAIEDSTFNACVKLAEVNIGDGVETIGEYAFYACALTSINIPNSVKTIKGGAFQECRKLATVTFGSGLETIGDRAFNNCESLTQITIPNSVKTIGGGAFYDCPNLREVSLGNSLEVIPGNAFGNCHALTSITIPDSVTYIGEGAFENCSSLTSITIPDNVKIIKNHTFNGCFNLAEVTIGKGVETIEHNAFNACGKLTNIIIPDNVKTIGEQAFNACESLATVTLGNGLETICNEAFNACVSLNSITIPQSVKEITGNPFAGCKKIKAFYGKFTSEDNTTLSKDGVIIAIANYESLIEYTIPNGITKIADSAFANWYNLQTINIPESVTSIGAGAFSGCDNLQSINIPEGITTIKGGTFSNCNNLKQITLPNSLTKIESEAFTFSGLTEITIPDNVTEIGGGVFGGCDNLTSFRGKFASADNKSLIIDNKLIAYAYSGLTEYIISEGVITLGEFSFLWIIGQPMATISLPNSLTTIEDWAFYDCRTISEITIPENVTYIGGFNMDNLSKIYCKATTPPTLNGNPFEGSQTPTHTIYVPSASVMAYRSAPGWSDYASMIVGYDFDKGVEIDPNTQIFYTSSDGKVVNPNAASWGGATIISNTYKNGQGVITFSQSLTEISDNAFEGCSTLTGVNLPNSVEIIKEHAFIQCTSLRSITLPTSVTTIEAGAFMLCSSLSSITIPNSVTVIKGSAFNLCI